MTKPNQAFKIKFDVSPLNDKLDSIGGAALAGVRPAAQAGVQVLYNEVRLQVPVGEKEFHWFHGKSFKTTGKKYPQNSGDLKRAVYQAFSADRSWVSASKYADKDAYVKATYHVSWRHKNAKGFRGAPYGFMVLLGTSRSSANDFMGRSYDAKSKEALKVAEARWAEETKKVL